MIKCLCYFFLPIQEALSETTLKFNGLELFQLHCTSSFEGYIFVKQSFLLAKPAVGQVMITLCMKLSDLTSQAGQVRQNVLAVDCKDPLSSKDGSEVIQIPSRRDDTGCSLLDQQHILTASSVTPKFYTTADMAVKHEKIHIQMFIRKHWLQYKQV